TKENGAVGRANRATALVDDDERGQNVTVLQPHADDVRIAPWFEVARAAIQENGAAVKPHAHALFRARSGENFETRIGHSGDQTRDVARFRPDRARGPDAFTARHHVRGAG